jgi:MFS family permease
MLSTAGSVGSGLVNGLTRITMGSLTDKYSFKLLFGIMMCVQLFNSLICFWAANSPGLFVLCIQMNYFSIGGLFAVFPSTVMNVFGFKHGPQVYTLVLLGSLMSSIVNLIMTKLILPGTGFLFCFSLGSVVTVICLVILWQYDEKLDAEWLAKKNAIVRRKLKETDTKEEE